MVSRRTIFGLAALAPLLAAPLLRARATSTTPGADDGPDIAALKRMAAAYPQPVRVGDLPHRYLLAPSEEQTVLGHVAEPAILRQSDGSLAMAIDRGGFLGFGATRVLVPVTDVALSGYYVILVGFARSELDALPPAMATASALPPDTTIRMGIVGPFH